LLLDFALTCCEARTGTVLRIPLVRDGVRCGVVLSGLLYNLGPFRNALQSRPDLIVQGLVIEF
jgi:hypothetical protein